jgi:iron complex outermembrane receptor protein
MSPKLRASIHRILFATGALAASVTTTVAQEALSTDEIAEIVIVTGSYIRGTAEDAALPVDVISTEELEKQGAPSTLDMLKSLTVANGIIGESNRFTSGRGQAQQGAAEINLRGFGAARTLVLVNGKRPATGDANRLLPANAIARIEVLKDGGASTYGTDAIGGVVNFITKDRVNGLELSADYRHIEDSDGDYNAGLLWGTSGDRWDFYFAGNYFHRSRLEARERDWALRPYYENPEGGWSTGSNPGSFIFQGPYAPLSMSSQRHDPGCEFFGGQVITGVASVVGAAAGTQCRTQFTQWDNLVEEQDTYQTFAKFSFDISDTTQLNVEALYAFTDVPNAGATPTATTTRPVTATVLPPRTSTTFPFGLGADNPNLSSPARSSFFYVPLNNPGLTPALLSSGFVPTGATGAYILLNQWRPFLATGNPAHDDGTQTYDFEREHWRVAAELTGEIGSVAWTSSLSYGVATSKRYEVDVSTARLQLALRGLGGPNCDWQSPTATPGQNGCLWFNPFSTGIAQTRDGVPNPLYDPAADVNTRELMQWLEDDMLAKSQARVGEFNLVFSGELPIQLPGGNVGWAVGAQYRKDWTIAEYSNASNRATNPCVDTPVTGRTNCAPMGESPYNFLATYNNIDVNRDVYAVFTEVSLPIVDSFNVQLAARFEDYGNQGGSSFDPKLSFRWQVLDQLALRGSVSTTFRAPPQTSLIPDEAIAFTNIFGTNRPVGTVGNPDLDPEESFQWTVGAIVNVGGFRALIDYWRFDIDKLLTVEPTSGILNIVFPNGATGPDNCATADPAFLASRFVFSNGVCGANNILKLVRQQINGAGLVNDGVDITLDYTFDNVFGGTLSVGATATWIHQYKTESLVINGVTFERGFDGVGFLNNGTTLYALPEWRAQAYLEYNFDRFNVRWTASFVDQYRDQRDGVERDGIVRENIFTPESPNGRIIDSSIVHSVTLRTALPADTTLLATIENVFDEDPPFARMELNYDPLTAQLPLGRTFKIGVRKKF